MLRQWALRKALHKWNGSDAWLCMICMFLDVLTEVSTGICTGTWTRNSPWHMPKHVRLYCCICCLYWTWSRHKNSTSTAMYQYLALTMTNAWHIGWQGYVRTCSRNCFDKYLVTCTCIFAGMFWPHGLTHWWTCAPLTFVQLAGVLE